MPTRERRWNGWGFEGESFPLPEAAGVWLNARLGAGDGLPTVREGEIEVPPPRPLPKLPVAADAERGVRLRNACGHAFPDVVALRTGAIPAFPDGVPRRRNSAT